MATHGLEQRIAERMAALERADLRRTLRPPSGIDLSSNDYLALARDPRIVESLVAAARREGCGATGSRLLRGERAVFTSVERRFARFKGTSASLYFTSGYAANLGVLATFLEPGDVVFSDALNHASLIDGLRLARARRVVFPHGDAPALAALIEAERGPGQRFVVTESVFSMDGDSAPLADYAEICRASGAALIVDEAHAVGVRGPGGSGLIDETGTRDTVLLSINTAGKALGVAGAFVAGPEWAVEYLVQKARTFVFSTAPPPSLAAALETAIDIVEAEPERRARVRENTALLRRRLSDAGLAAANGTHIVPVVLGEPARAAAVAGQLAAAGFDVRAIRPPTVPPGTSRLRVSINAGLDATTIARFAEALVAATGAGARPAGARP
jgi:8-amino-7-oxononanoate synthase